VSFQSFLDRPDPIDPTPTIEIGVPGPRGDEGFLLRARRDEALLWDVENEIGSARRRWMEELGGWWIDASYLQTVIDITLRSFPSVLVLNGPHGDRLHSRDGVTAIQERLL
jgi:hypothetical protein